MALLTYNLKFQNDVGNYATLCAPRGCVCRAPAVIMESDAAPAALLKFAIRSRDSPSIIFCGVISRPVHDLRNH